MQTPSDPPLGGLSVRSEPSASRRRLLKAAARSAPLIATLPSGAALANASAFQCLDPLLDANPPGAISSAAPDGYIRVRGILKTWRVPPTTIVQAYEFAWRGVSVRVDKDGNLFEPPPRAIPRPDQAVDLLVLYRSQNDLENPVTKDCEVRTGLNWSPQSPQNCVWPIAQVQGGVPGNVAMARSCWCSISPGDSEAGCILPP